MEHSRIIPIRPDKNIREVVRHPLAVGLAVFLVVCSISLARSVLIPVALALFCFLVLNGVIRNLERFHIPRPISLGVLLALSVAVVGLLSSALLESGWEWIANAHRSMDMLETRVREILPFAPGGPVPEAIADMENSGGIAALVTDGVAGNAGFVVGHGVLVAVLLLFLLASGDRFWVGVSNLCSTSMDKGEFLRLVQEAEMRLSTYFFTVAAINTTVGLLIGFGMFFLGMPDPILWGIAAGLLNFVPYLGALAGEVVVTIVALVTFDSAGYAILAPLFYFTVAFVEGNLITPMILGKRFIFRPVIIILSMMFWGWLWGVVGLFLAFPMLMLFGIVCENVPSLEPTGRFLRPGKESLHS